jgi:vacuolar-type H+-ATPase subunit D/Vma8
MIAICVLILSALLMIWATDKRLNKLKQELEVERRRINMLKIDVNYLWNELRNGEDNGGEG